MMINNEQNSLKRMPPISPYYTSLYQSLTESGYAPSDYSHFIAMAGKEFLQSDAVRLMIIGRAVNGWERLNTGSAVAFGEEAEKLFHAEGFSWVAGEKENLYSTHHLPEEKPSYYLNRSAFWRVAKRVLEGLFPYPLTGRWIDYLAWSNLYKIAPLKTGNPKNKLCNLQAEDCRKLLAEEIERYQPTHILMLTGWNWFQTGHTNSFYKIFTDCQKRNSPKKGLANFVEGTAYFLLSENRKIPVVVTCRPEAKKEKSFCKEVLEYFNKKNISD